MEFLFWIRIYNEICERKVSEKMGGKREREREDN